MASNHLVTALVVAAISIGGTALYFKPKAGSPVAPLASTPKEQEASLERDDNKNTVTYKVDTVAGELVLVKDNTNLKYDLILNGKVVETQTDVNDITTALDKSYRVGDRSIVLIMHINPEGYHCAATIETKVIGNGKILATDEIGNCDDRFEVTYKSDEEASFTFMVPDSKKVESWDYKNGSFTHVKPHKPKTNVASDKSEVKDSPKTTSSESQSVAKADPPAPKPKRRQSSSGMSGDVVSRYAEGLARRFEQASHPACGSLAMTIRSFGNSNLPDYIRKRQVDAVVDHAPEVCFY